MPALLFGAGAIGFFAAALHGHRLPAGLPGRCSGSGRCRTTHGYVTPADFVRGRFGSPTLALLVAITGIVATMPYIALQLVGIEAVLKPMRVHRAPGR